MMRLLWIICFAMAFLASRAMAAPYDSPDTVYINGQPCGNFCQLFFNRPRLAAPEQRNPRAIARSKRRPVETKKGPSKSADDRGKRSRLAAQLLPPPRPRPLFESASNPTQATIAKPRQPISPIVEAPPKNSGIVDVTPPGASSASIDPPTATSGIVTPPSANDARIQPAVTLDALDQLASLLASEAGRDNYSEADSRDPEITGTVRKNDPRLAVVIAKNEVRSIAELAGKIVAIDGGLSQQNAAIRTALVAAGASEVQMSGDQTKAIDRMVRHEVPAAVLGLVSRDGANRIPEIEGYRIFRVPLSPY
jgi:hypothetical protein